MLNIAKNVERSPLKQRVETIRCPVRNLRKDSKGSVVMDMFHVVITVLTIGERICVVAAVVKSSENATMIFQNVNVLLSQLIIWLLNVQVKTGGVNMITNEIKEEIKRYKSAINDLINGLKKQILELPDNPNIKRISDSPHCFTVNFSQLHDNWSPEYYDFKKQYEVLVDVLFKSEPEKVLSRLEQILRDSSVKFTENGVSRVFRFHPTVMKNVMELGNYRWKSVVVWPDGTCSTSVGKDMSYDFHASYNEANSICQALCEDGFGGDRKRFPITTVIELCQKDK